MWCVLLFRRLILFFFFKQKTAYELRISDWSSDVCSSDLELPAERQLLPGRQFGHDIMIIGVEPFGHFARRQAGVAMPAAVLATGGAARHREIGDRKSVV